MSNFDERERGFEAKFAHDEGLRFKATARRNKLVGLWAADLMGITGDEAAEYAKEVVKADFEEAGDEDVIRKVHGDLQAKGVDKSADEIRAQLIIKMGEAVGQVEKEG
ncbi:MAG: DUF1476 domain-containing protein [Pseudomonadota bacterium]